MKKFTNHVYPHLKNKNVPLNTFTCIDTYQHGYNRDIYKKVLVTFSLFLRSCFDTLFRAIYQNPNQCPCNNNKNNIYIYIHTCVSKRINFELTNKVITVLLRSNISRSACSRNAIKSRSSWSTQKRCDFTNNRVAMQNIYIYIYISIGQDYICILYHLIM